MIEKEDGALLKYSDHEAALKAKVKGCCDCCKEEAVMICHDCYKVEYIEPLESALKAKEEEIVELKEIIDQNRIDWKEVCERNKQLKDKDARIAEAEQEILKQKDIVKAYIIRVNYDKAKLTLALEALEKAKQFILDWSSYADLYYREKHGLDDDIKEIEDAIKKIKGE